MTSAFLQLRDQAIAQVSRCVHLKHPVWIFGAGNFGRALASALQAQGFPVAGYVETAPKAHMVQGLPVLNWPTLAGMGTQVQLVMGILNRDAAYDRLVAIATKAGFQPPLMPWELYDQLGAVLGWRFWLGDRAVFVEHLDRLALVAEQLGDRESKEILLRICAFRLGLDLEYSSFLSDEPQYFNALTLPKLQGRAITYIDCGAYDGDTYVELMQLLSIDCCQAFLLEPDPDNYAALVARMSGLYPKVVYLPLAASNKYSILSFTSGQGEGSSIGSSGKVKVAAVALDQIFPQGSVDFLKLDVEGAEAVVLDGARQLIKRCRPVLAVSLYHKPQDLWELPELLFALCHDYKFYIRQHCFNSFDSVLYAVPRG